MSQTHEMPPVRASLADIRKSYAALSGIDLTPQMAALCRRRIERAGPATRVEVREADARSLPYAAASFDAVHMLSTLELFDTPDIPRVLCEVKRVLKPQGRLGLGSLSREGHERSTVLRLCEWLCQKLPRYASCRPICVERLVKEGGFSILKGREVHGFFPMKLLVAVQPTGTRVNRPRNPTWFCA